MQVVGYSLRLHAEELLQVAEGLFKEAQCLVVLKITNVLAEDRVTIARQAKGVLQLRPARQDGRHWHAEIDRKRRVPAGAAEHPLAALRNAHYGIVCAHVDVPIVEQAPVGQRRQARTSL